MARKKSKSTTKKDQAKLKAARLRKTAKQKVRQIELQLTKAVQLQCLIKTLNTARQTEYVGKFANYFDVENYGDIVNDGKNLGKSKSAFNKIMSEILKAVKINRVCHQDVYTKSFKYLDVWELSITFKSPIVGLPQKKGDKFVEVNEKWFTVKKSTIENAGLGLFVARKFGKDECIGMYLGPLTIFQPSTETKPTIYCNHSDILGYCDPRAGFKSNKNKTNPSYQMGLHIMNDPNFMKRKNTKTDYNTSITDDFLVFASRNIKEGEELFLDYNYQRQF